VAWDMKTKLLIFLSILSLLPLAKADYCDLNLHPQLVYAINDTTFGSFNLTKISPTQYQVSYFDNSTNTTHDFILNLECNQTKTFFIINNQTYLETRPNQTINFDFIIAPIVFTNYTIHSFGLFDIVPISTYLDDLFYYNLTQTFPVIPSGIYYQTFEVSNGLQTQYIIYTINNTLTLNPIILKFDYSPEMTYAKFYDVSLLAENLNKARVEIANQTFELTNSTKYYWEGKIYVLNQTSKIKVVAENDYGSVSEEYDVVIEDLSFPVNNIVLPAVAINQSSKVLLIDFGVDLPINLNVASTPILTANETQTYDYYIVDENDRMNPTQAKKLFLILNPHQPTRNVLEINISSPFFSQKTIRVEFLGSSVPYPNEVNLTYYNKPTYCKLVGDNLLNSSYECKFYVPYNMNPQSLQSTELEALKTAYETKIEYLNKDIDNLKLQRLGAFVVIAIIVICLAVYYLKDKIILMGW
jgi:hypothetical protein